MALMFNTPFSPKYRLQDSKHQTLFKPYAIGIQVVSHFFIVVLHTIVFDLCVILWYSVSLLSRLEEYCITFRDFTTVTRFNTLKKCSIYRSKARALQHVSWLYSCLVAQYYCLVALYYTITHSVTYKYEPLAPMECTQRSIALLFEEYGIFVRLQSCPLTF